MISAAAVKVTNATMNDARAPMLSHRTPPMIPLKKTPRYMKQLKMPTPVPFFCYEVMSMTNAVV
jgi:hypothetical protein